MKLAIGFGSAALVLVTALSGCDEDVTATPLPGDAGAATDATSSTDAPSTTDGGDGGVCAPQVVTGFTPTWTPPNGLHQNKCSPTQIETLVDCVYKRPNYNKATCDAFFAEPSNKNCIDCGYTKTTSPQLGAIISNDTAVQVNYAGCVALFSNDVTANGCGAKLQASEACLSAACVAACPVPANDEGNKAFAAYVKCTEDAAKTVCKTFSDQTACATPLTTGAGAASACLPNTQDFGERAAIYVGIFCGAPGGDAGADAPSDG